MTTVVIPTYMIGPKVIELVREARRRVVLVTPFIRTWGHLEEALQAAGKRGVETTVLFRADKVEEYRDMSKKLLGYGVKLGTINNLHAKVYANESSCLLTSMNLYDVSAQNNEEFALHTTETELLRATMEYTNDLLQRATLIKGENKAIGAFKSAVGLAAGAASAVAVAVNPASCIRCGEKIAWNFEKPMCAGCYSAWSKYKNPEYVEKFCHDCGKPHKSSMLKPVCLSCYKRTK